MDDIIVGLDIGTTKVCAVIGELKEDRTINVLGAGSCSYTDGVKKGAIVDIKKTTEAIVYAIEEAEKSVDVSENSKEEESSESMKMSHVITLYLKIINKKNLTNIKT